MFRPRLVGIEAKIPIEFVSIIFAPQAPEIMILKANYQAIVLKSVAAGFGGNNRDGNAWLNPFLASNRNATDTTYRTALLFGIPKARLDDNTPDQGGGDRKSVV